MRYKIVHTPKSCRHIHGGYARSGGPNSDPAIQIPLAGFVSHAVSAGVAPVEVAGTILWSCEKKIDKRAIHAGTFLTQIMLIMTFSSPVVF